MVLLHDIPNLLWLSNDAVATFVVDQISCNWDNLTRVKITLLFLLCTLSLSVHLLHIVTSNSKSVRLRHVPQQRNADDKFKKHQEGGAMYTDAIHHFSAKLICW